MVRPKGTARGIGRSLRVYYGDRDREARMDALYALFVRPGARVFDIGAHVGDRVSSFRRLGAHVVAAEPQPGAFRALRLIHGRDSAVTLMQAALGDRPGRAVMHVNTRNPTISTLSEDFIRSATGAPGWEGQDWDSRTEVPVVTLDALIALHGQPDFIKIDVEGHEDKVLEGLTHPVHALSFEVTTIERAIAARCLERLADLGRYRFRLSLGECHRFFEIPDRRGGGSGNGGGDRLDAGASDHWCDGRDMKAMIDALPHDANSGDVHAVLTR